MSINGTIKSPKKNRIDQIALIALKLISSKKIGNQKISKNRKRFMKIFLLIHHHKKRTQNVELSQKEINQMIVQND